MSPRSQVAFTDQSLSVKFTCKAVDVISATWIVNGTYYTNLSSSVLADIEFIRTDENGHIITIVLNIAASTIYNGTLIQCSILGMDELLTSQPVSMILQGMLYNIIVHACVHIGLYMILTILPSYTKQTLVN